MVTVIEKSGKDLKLVENMPKLRFSGLTGAWCQKKLGEICEYKNGGSFENEVVENGRYNLITLNSIDIHGKIKNIHKTVDNADWFLKKGDLIMVLSDVAHGNFLGLVDIIPEDNKYVLNQRMGLLRNIDSNLDLNFLRIYINRNQHYFKLHGQGSSQQNLSKGDILKFIVKFPSLNEQQRISGVIESIEAWIGCLSSQKEALETYRKGIVNKIFSQEIRFKDQSGEPFPTWKNISLNELLDFEQPAEYIVKSTVYKNEYQTPVLTAGKTFILGYTNELEGIFDASKQPVIIFDDFTTTSKFVDFPFKVKSSAMKILIGKENVNIRFVFEAMQLIRYKIGGHGRHWISKYSKLLIPTPTFAEQKKIVEILSSIDSLIVTKNDQIFQAEKWKMGLMQQLFI